MCQMGELNLCFLSPFFLTINKKEFPKNECLLILTKFTTVQKTNKQKTPNDSSNADFQMCYALTKQESMTVLLTGTQPWKETTDAKHSLLLEATWLASPKKKSLKGTNRYVLDFSVSPSVPYGFL